MVAFGAATAYWLNYGLSMTMNPLDPLIYTIPLGLQVLPAACLVLGMLAVPKSPRWLASKGLYEEASLSLSVVRELDPKSCEIQSEIEGYRHYFATCKESSWLQVFDSENRPRLWVGVSLILFQQFAGQNCINYFAPQVWSRPTLGFQSAWSNRKEHWPFSDWICWNRKDSVCAAGNTIRRSVWQTTLISAWFYWYGIVYALYWLLLSAS